MIYGIQAACIIVLSDGYLSFDHQSYAEIYLSGNHVLFKAKYLLANKKPLIVYAYFISTIFSQLFMFERTFHRDLRKKPKPPFLGKQCLLENMPLASRSPLLFSNVFETIPTQSHNYG